MRKKRRALDDSIIESVFNSISSSSYYRTCRYCQQSLEGGAYTAAWENGDNPDGYIRCPHCRRANFDD